MEFRPHRRRVLQLGSSGFIAWGLAPLVDGCSGRSSQVARARADDLEDAWRLAQADRRPLLVLLADPRSPADRGIQWSAYFDLASDEALGELASCELAFAVPDQIRAALPCVPLDQSDLPQAVLVEPDGRTTASVPPVRPEPKWWVLTETGEPEPLRGWIAQFEAAMHAVFLSSPSVPRTGSRPDLRQAADSLRSRLRESAPAGGKWAKRFGMCGSIEFEDGSELSQSEAGIACGMAFHSENSRRFLWLYTERKG